jgi:hypothetical protein
LLVPGDVGRTHDPQDWFALALAPGFALRTRKPISKIDKKSQNGIKEKFWKGSTSTSLAAPRRAP